MTKRSAEDAAKFSPDLAQIPAKITLAIERLATAYRNAQWQAAKTHGFSPLQLQILAFVAAHPAPMNTVTHLAREFGVTKATLSDAVRVLLDKGALGKMGGADARSFALGLTPAGAAVQDQAASLNGFYENTLGAASTVQILQIWQGLLVLMAQLQRSGAVPLRMCLSCQHFDPGPGLDTGNLGQRSYCRLMKAALHLPDIRLDCPDHVAAGAQSDRKRDPNGNMI